MLATLGSHTTDFRSFFKRILVMDEDPYRADPPPGSRTLRKLVRLEGGSCSLAKICASSFLADSLCKAFKASRRETFELFFLIIIPLFTLNFGRTMGIEPTIAESQSAALPLGYARHGPPVGNRTRIGRLSSDCTKPLCYGGLVW
jgi:hypothetical protein